MAYDLFLFDLDDTLLDFKASERLSFSLAMKSLGLTSGLEELFKQYQVVNTALWKDFEKGLTTKDHIKVERFRKIFEPNGIEIDPALAGGRYLDTLPETVVLVDHAAEICEWLCRKGEIGIITNGIESVQSRRIQNSKLAPYISFVSVSDACGFAKPDVRFFEHTAKMAKKFSKASSIMVGDRIETDILGAHNFGVASCWFNPLGTPHDSTEVAPAKYEVKHLSELRGIIEE